MAASPKPEPLKIFISHSEADLEAARGVHRALRAAGLRAWMREEDLREEDVELGSTWREAVDKALEASDLFLFLLSSESNHDRNQVLDLWSAKREEKKVVPAFLEADFLVDDYPGKLWEQREFLKERRGEVIDSAEGLARLIRGLQRLNQRITGAPLREPAPASEPVRGRLRVSTISTASPSCGAKPIATPKRKPSSSSYPNGSTRACVLASGRSSKQWKPWSPRREAGDQ